MTTKPHATKSLLQLRLFGPFSVGRADGALIDVRSAKTKALLALLATAPDRKRTRVFLQEMLWGRSGQELGRASLRQCLSNLKRLVGPSLFDGAFVITSDSIGLNPSKVTMIGTRSDGELLEGIFIRSEDFKRWLADARLAAARQPPAQEPRPLLGDAAAPLAPTVPVAHVLPVVAVLPFSGMDAGPSAMFGDAVAQDVTRALSRSPLTMVISHLSSRDPRLRAASVDEIRGALGADYVVTGQTRVNGDSFLLDVDFVDVATRELAWTHTTSGSLSAFFAGGGNAARELAGAIAEAVQAQSLKPLSDGPLDNIECHRLLMAGVTLMHKQQRASFATARRCIEAVVERAPDRALPRAWLAKWYVLAINQGWSERSDQDISLAHDAAAAALERNPACPFSLSINGFVNHHLYRFEEAFAYHDAALTHDPNNALAYLLTAVLHTFEGKGDLAIAAGDKAAQLSPLDPHRYFFDCVRAGAYAVQGNHERALALADRSFDANRHHASTVRIRTFALQQLGRRDEARRSADWLLKLDPDFTIAKYRAKHPSMNFSTGDVWCDVLNKAGVPLR
ncbi:MAG: hypothetical protein AAF318_07695 [Pseudomonadota bacterium]